MRRIIVSDESGRIIATGPHPEDVAEMRGKFGFMALPGQKVHEVELPAHITTLKQLQELHSTHHVKLEGGRARLAEHKR